MAARYSFTETEIRAMPMRRMNDWHEGHLEMVAEDDRRTRAMVGGAGGGTDD